MEIIERLVQDCVILDIHESRFEATKTAELKKRAMNYLDKGHQYLALNLAGVGYLDSFGLATIISLLKECRTRGGDLVLYGLNDTGCRLITVTRLDKVLTVWEKEQQAVEALLQHKHPTAAIGAVG